MEIEKKIERIRKDAGASGVIEVKDIGEYIDLSDLDEETKLKIQRRLNLLSRGISYTGVLTCRGAKNCVYGDQCPFKGMEPINEKCPFEMAYVDKLLSGYFKSLGIEFGDVAEMSQLQSLVDVELKIMRANAKLSAEGFEQNVYKQGADGSTFVEKKEHHILRTIDRLNELKIKLLKAFNATRDSRKQDNKVMDISLKLSREE